MVEEVNKGSDNVLCEVMVKYCNSSEQRLSLIGEPGKDKALPRYTKRTMRKTVKVFSLDDARLCDDIKEFEKKMKHMPQSFQDDLRSSEEMAALVKTRADFERVHPAKVVGPEDR